MLRPYTILCSNASSRRSLPWKLFAQCPPIDCSIIPCRFSLRASMLCPFRYCGLASTRVPAGADKHDDLVFWFVHVRTLNNPMYLRFIRPLLLIASLLVCVLSLLHPSVHQLWDGRQRFALVSMMLRGSCTTKCVRVGSAVCDSGRPCPWSFTAAPRHLTGFVKSFVTVRRARMRLTPQFSLVTVFDQTSCSLVRSRELELDVLCS